MGTAEKHGKGKISFDVKKSLDSGCFYEKITYLYRALRFNL